MTPKREHLDQNFLSVTSTFVYLHFILVKKIDQFTKTKLPTQSSPLFLAKHQRVMLNLKRLTKTI